MTDARREPVTAEQKEYWRDCPCCKNDLLAQLPEA